MKKILLLILMAVFLAAPAISYAKINFEDADKESSSNPYNKTKCDGMTTLTKCVGS